LPSVTAQNLYILRLIPSAAPGAEGTIRRDRSQNWRDVCRRGVVSVGFETESKPTTTNYKA